ncbi:hypothetical protein F511_47085 [Dorcoceras hygrometricum]|uniref:Uncharacterized protein n=1 Tax=Dorcoceras hygrometricum TaxID=472368 RepID=A0A2Z6ZSZ6_9LAMI|nr:hypothetical protein F511_47085 [Dorcoceras hygrometricum]
MSTAELNSNGESDRSLQKKRTQVLLLLQRSVAPKWKEDKITFWSAEQIWKLSNGKKISRGYILEATPIEESKELSALVLQFRVNETLCVRSVGATTILWEIFIDYTVHQQRENNLK